MKKLTKIVITTAILLGISVTAFADDGATVQHADKTLTAGTHTVTISSGDDADTGVNVLKSFEANDGATVSYNYDYGTETGTFKITEKTVNENGETVTVTVGEVAIPTDKASDYFPRGIHPAGDQDSEGRLSSTTYSVSGDMVFVLSYGHIGEIVEYTVYCKNARGTLIGETSGYTMKGYAGQTIPVPVPEVEGYRLKSPTNPEINLATETEITLTYDVYDEYNTITETVIIPGRGTGSTSGTTSGSEGTTIPDESVPQGVGNSGTNSGTDIESESVPGGNQPGSGSTRYIPAAVGGVGLLGLLLLLAKKKKENDEQPEG